jgi:hypothetical protein
MYEYEKEDKIWIIIKNNRTSRWLLKTASIFLQKRLYKMYMEGDGAAAAGVNEINLPQKDLLHHIIQQTPISQQTFTSRANPTRHKRSLRRADPLRSLHPHHPEHKHHWHQ